MYMHTLDGQPASFDDRNGAYLFFVGGRHRVRLARSLRQITREQQAARIDALKNPNTVEWGERSRYGYVLVEVP